jgi:hypothetical protein
VGAYRKTTRKMPVRQCPIAEDAPIEIHKMWRDRRGHSLVFALRSYQGRVFFDLRTYYTDQDGVSKPTGKGVTAAPHKLPEITRAMVAALERARELGLLSEASE